METINKFLCNELLVAKMKNLKFLELLSSGFVSIFPTKTWKCIKKLREDINICK